MRLDQLSGIVAFLKVAETQSFTRAAAELGVAPPSLSEAVRGLESRLGVRLFNRTTRSVGLTEEGAAYLQRVAPAAEEIRAAGAALSEARDRVAGTLRLTVPWIAAPLLIEPLMRGFLDKFPDVKLDIVFEDSFVDLASGGFDAGIRIGDLLEKDMVAVRLGGPLRTAVLASPTYIEAHGRPSEPSDLSNHRCIAYRFASTRAIAPWEFSQDSRLISFVPDPRLSCNTMAMAVAAAIQGIGVTYTTKKLAKAHMANNSLVSLLDDYCPYYEPLHIYYPSRRLSPPKLTAFVEFARMLAKANLTG